MTVVSGSPVLDLGGLKAEYETGRLTPTAVVEAVFDRISARGGDGVWISLAARDTALAEARRLEAMPAQQRATLALWGAPFSVKDCIDVAGMPTTSACPEFAYMPASSSPAVARLLAAGAILIGKTNMDQFATGLVGVRSPYGVARNPFNPDYIPGGSSSGAAVSVAAGLVSFALGTDTGGSGRVPAAFNGIVGLKPTRGLISGTGVVPACRSIETISIFAATVRDARTVFEVMRSYDAGDPFARIDRGGRPHPPGASFRIGVPQSRCLDESCDREVRALFERAVQRLERLGGTRVEIDYAPFVEINDFLFMGAWLAERYGVLKDFLSAKPSAVLPVTREIVSRGKDISGAEVFAAQQRLRVLKRELSDLWSLIDVLAVPTTGISATLSAVEADPVALNARLGTYTNFVNLADLSAVAVPCGWLPTGMPHGMTLIGQAFDDAYLAGIADRFGAATGGDLPAGVVLGN